MTEDNSETLEESIGTDVTDEILQALPPGAGGVSDLNFDSLMKDAGITDTPPAALPVPTAGGTYSLIVVPAEGQPYIRIYKSGEALARELSELAGADAYAIPLVGYPLRYTTAPCRLLYIPDQPPIQFSPILGGPVGDAQIVAAALQDDFYLGPDFAIRRAAAPEPQLASGKQKRPPRGQHDVGDPTPR